MMTWLLLQMVLSVLALGFASRLCLVMWSDRRMAGPVPPPETEVLLERLRSAQVLWALCLVAAIINVIQWLGVDGWGSSYAVAGTVGRGLLVLWAWRRLQSWHRLRRRVRWEMDR